MFQCFPKVMRISTVTMLKIKILSFSGWENLQKNCIIYDFHRIFGRLRRGFGSKNSSFEPSRMNNHGVTTRCCLQKNLSRTTKSSGARSEYPFKKSLKATWAAKKKKNGDPYFPLNPGWFPYVLVYFKNPPHNWGFRFHRPKTLNNQGGVDHLGSCNINPQFLGLGF